MRGEIQSHARWATTKMIVYSLQWRIHDFSEMVAATYDFAKLSKKLHEIWKNLDPRGARPKWYYVDLDTPLIFSKAALYQFWSCDRNGIMNDIVNSWFRGQRGKLGFCHYLSFQFLKNETRNFSNGRLRYNLGIGLVATAGIKIFINVTVPHALWMVERPGDLWLNHSWFNFNIVY